MDNQVGMHVDMPHLSTLELSIVEKLSDSVSKGRVSNILGIPPQAIAQLLRKKGVKEYIQELKEAKREALLAYSIDVVAATLQDKMEMIEEDEDKRLGSATKKDHIELAQRLTEMLKGSSGQTEDDNNPMAKIYQQINVIQNGGA